MSIFVDAFFTLLLHRFFAYPLVFGFVVACFGLAMELFRFRSGGGR